jgi:hypothetical protein
MADGSSDGDIRPTLSIRRRQSDFFRRHFRRSASQHGMAERVARRMIARHGASAAREATLQLNQTIDRGDLSARDLWACVVHLIHERQQGGALDGDGEADAFIKSGQEIAASRQLALAGK